MLSVRCHFEALLRVIRFSKEGGGGHFLLASLAGQIQGLPVLPKLLVPDLRPSLRYLHPPPTAVKSTLTSELPHLEIPGE